MITAAVVTWLADANVCLHPDYLSGSMGWSAGGLVVGFVLGRLSTSIWERKHS